MLKLLIALIFVSTNLFASRSFDISYPHSFSTVQKDLFEKVLANAYLKLPTEIKEYGINIVVKKLGKVFSADFCAENSKNIFGLATTIGKNKTLYVNENLITLSIEKSGTDFDCYHKTYLKTLQATILHELLHFYDNKHKISKSEQFKSLVGGGHSNPLKKKKLMNKSIHGTPDYYEYKNYKEALAVNFEYFVLDETYQCLKPAYYAFLKEKLGIIPFASQDCSNYTSVLVSHSDFNLNLKEMAILDHQRIYQIHYLHAGDGTEIMSRWGHAMYRIITCAPHRSQVGPECLNDVSHHLVVSYRANISDVSINYLNGLFGSYPSQIFIYRLIDVVHEYTRGELRDLWSVPLNLSPQEKNQFVNITLQRFWDYRGSYYFFSNNCATESRKHLLAIIEEDKGKLKSITPRKIFQSVTDLEKDFVIKDQFDVSDKERMKRDGLLFESEATELSMIASQIAELGYPLFKSLDTLKESIAMQRMDVYLELINLNSNDNIIFYNSLLRLEKYLGIIFNQKLSEKLIKMAQRNEHIKEQLDTLMQENDTIFLDQWKIIKHVENYGVPSSNDVLLGLENLPVIDQSFNQLMMDIFQENALFSTIEAEAKTLSQINLLLKQKIKDIAITL
jgi:predicted Zn-dependent protease with MMP-like domain